MTSDHRKNVVARTKKMIPQCRVMAHIVGNDPVQWEGKNAEKNDKLFNSIQITMLFHSFVSSLDVFNV